MLVFAAAIFVLLIGVALLAGVVVTRIRNQNAGTPPSPVSVGKPPRPGGSFPSEWLKDGNTGNTGNAGNADSLWGPIPPNAGKLDQEGGLPHGGPKDTNPDSGGAPPENTEFMVKLNKYRADHQAPPVQWDPTAAAYAQQWAKACCPGDELQHTQNGKYGENMGWESAVKALDGWYSEVVNVPWGNPAKYYEAAGHFTALVWKDTTHVGVGTYTRANGSTVVVASFFPPGNADSSPPTGEYFAKNVLPKK